MDVGCRSGFINFLLSDSRGKSRASAYTSLYFGQLRQQPPDDLNDGLLPLSDSLCSRAVVK